MSEDEFSTWTNDDLEELTQYDDMARQELARRSNTQSERIPIALTPREIDNIRAAAKQEIVDLADKYYNEIAWPSLATIAEFDTTINWLDGVAVGFLTGGDADKLHGALDGSVGWIGQHLGEIAQKSALMSTEQRHSVMTVIKPTAESFAVALTSFLNNRKTEDFLNVTRPRTEHFRMSMLKHVETLIAEGVRKRSGPAGGLTEQQRYLGKLLKYQIEPQFRYMSDPDLFLQLENELIQQISQRKDGALSALSALQRPITGKNENQVVKQRRKTISKIRNDYLNYEKVSSKT